VSYVDVFIPLLCGIVLVACPQAMFKPKGSEAEIAKKRKIGRICGFVLIAVAALYLFIKFASPHR